jgi:hypothetical protein
MKRIFAVALAASLAVLTVGTGAQAGGGSNARLSVVHGVPGLTVDVCLDGNEVLSGFMPGDTAGPLTVPAGPHTVTVHGADPAACAGAAVLTANLNLEAGKAYTGVAHLDSNGDPTISPFVDNLKKTERKQARLTVRHTAAAPAVTVWANGKALANGFENGDTATVDVKRGVYAAWVALDGTHEPVIGPAVLKLKPGTAYTVYAWGSAANDNLGLIVQEVEVGVKG